MSHSRKWKALSIPSFDGKKTELNVSGEVQSGIVPLVLTKRSGEMPANVYALNLAGLGGGAFENVSYQEDITNNKDLKVVLVFKEKDDLEAAIIIEEVLSL
jgi:hypothetical protein